MLKIILILLMMMVSVVSNAGFILDSLPEAKNLSRSTKKPILLILGSENCIYCKMLMQNITEGNLQNEVDPFIICYIDLDNNPEMKSVYNIKIIPVSIIIENNDEKSHLTGFNKDKYKEWLNAYKR